MASQLIRLAGVEAARPAFLALLASYKCYKLLFWNDVLRALPEGLMYE